MCPFPLTNGPKELTDKEKAFVHHIVHVNPGNSLEAARAAGYASAETNHWAISQRLKQFIVDEVQSYLVKHSSSAALQLVSMINSDDAIPQAQTKLAAANSILDRVGITKVDKSEVKHQHSGGIFFIPAKEPLPTADEVIDVEVADGN